MDRTVRKQVYATAEEDEEIDTDNLHELATHAN